jgi:hypothetical protein
MKKFLSKVDWVWMFRTVIGITFIIVGIVYKDWAPAAFGLLWIILGSYAAYYKTGCGYDRYCIDFTKYNKNESSNEIEFTEIK